MTNSTIKTWRERIGAGEDFPMHVPSCVERAMMNEIADLRAEAPVVAEGELHIGVANNDRGVHINIIQRHADGTATVVYSAQAPAGDSYARLALASAGVTQ